MCPAKPSARMDSNAQGENCHQQDDRNARAHDAHARTSFEIYFRLDCEINLSLTHSWDSLLMVNQTGDTEMTVQLTYAQQGFITQLRHQLCKLDCANQFGTIQLAQLNELVNTCEDARLIFAPTIRAITLQESN